VLSFFARCGTHRNRGQDRGHVLLDENGHGHFTSERRVARRIPADVSLDLRERADSSELPLLDAHSLPHAFSSDPSRRIRAPLRMVAPGVWDAIADTPEQSANLRARAELMQQIAELIQAEGWKQVEAAERCGVTQPRVNDLPRGRVSRFSLDALVNIATALGRRVSFELEAA
jgi:predicted XRE-type DNA-binding protein